MQHYELAIRSIPSDQVTFDELAARAEMHPELLARLVEFGLIEPVSARGDLSVFDSSKIWRLLCIRRLRSDLGINLQGVAVVLDLVERLGDLEREIASLRAWV
jgi:MerR family transcriptional regulator/heat shock protein HspR